MNIIASPIVRKRGAKRLPVAFVVGLELVIWVAIIGLPILAVRSCAGQ